MSRFPCLTLWCAAGISASSCGGGGGDPPGADNAPPVISVVGTLAGAAPRFTLSLPTGSTRTLEFQATDPDEDTLLWQVAVAAPAAASVGLRFASPVAGGSCVLTIDPVTAPAAANVTLLVEDPRGGAAAVDLLLVRSGAPTVTAISPSSAFAGQPQQVAVTGTAFRLGGTVTTAVRFDGLSATGVQVVDDTALACATPAHGQAGPTVVSVAHTYGTSSLPDSAFTLFQYPPSFAPTDQRLDAGSASAPQLALVGATAHAVWLENGVVLHRRSTDGGANWDPAQSISGAEVASEPQLLANGDDLLAAWIGDGQAVWMRRSADGGLSFLPAARIDGGTATPRSRPRVCQSGDRRHAAWVVGDAGAGTARLVATASADRGATWSNPAAVEDAGANQGAHVMAAEGADTWLVCEDERQGSPARGIYATRTANGGATWAPMRRLSQPGVVAGEPRLCAASPRVHAAWLRAGAIFYSTSVDRGATWSSAATEIRSATAGTISALQICCAAGSVHFLGVQAGNTVWLSRLPGAGAPVQHTRLDADATVDAEPQIAGVGNYVFAAWRQGDPGNGSARIRQTTSVDSGVTFVAATGLGDGTATQAAPQLLHDGARLCLGWLDSRSATVGLFVNRTAQ